MPVEISPLIRVGKVKLVYIVDFIYFGSVVLFKQTFPFKAHCVLRSFHDTRS